MFNIKNSYQLVGNLSSGKPIKKNDSKLTNKNVSWTRWFLFSYNFTPKSLKDWATQFLLVATCFLFCYLMHFWSTSPPSYVYNWTSCSTLIRLQSDIKICANTIIITNGQLQDSYYVFSSATSISPFLQMYSIYIICCSFLSNYSFNPSC